MNSYTTNSFIADNGKSHSPSFLYIIIPFVFGIAVDILFTQHLGTQFCSFDKTEYSCSIHGISIEQWQREAMRFILQLSLIMCVLLSIQRFSHTTVFPLYNSLFGIIGLILMFVAQVDLFSDFRRLCNGLVFSLKHN
jgi:hypothetical protein